MPSQYRMVERGRTPVRGLWAVGALVAMGGAALAGCQTSSDKPSDTFDGDGSTLPSRDATSSPPPEASTLDASLASDAFTGDSSDGVVDDAPDGPVDESPDAFGDDSSDAFADDSRVVLSDAGVDAFPDGSLYVPADAFSDGVAEGSDGSVCQPGQSFCGGGCTDTRSDPNNCGQCTNACGSGVDCINSQCACPVDAGQVLCNNTCVSIASDPSNCGVCGHFCQGSTCANSLCQATVIAQVTGAPIQDIVVDSAYVYWTQQAVAGSTGIVSTKPFAGSTTTLSIDMSSDSDLGDPRGIAVDTHNMYWVDVGSGAVETVDLMTAKRMLLKPSGGAADSPFDITSDGQNAYWVTYDGGQIISEPIGGGAQMVIASGENHPRAIAVDASNVYWIDYGNANPAVPSGSVKQAPKGAPSTPATLMVLAQNEDQPWDIAVDDTSVYWTDHANPGQVKKVPIGGSAVVSLATGQGAPYGVAVDADYVYWTNFNDKNVLRLSKSGGGQPFALASNQNTPSALVVDAKNVYWADPGANAILKVAK